MFHSFSHLDKPLLHLQTIKNGEILRVSKFIRKIYLYIKIYITTYSYIEYCSKYQIYMIIMNFNYFENECFCSSRYGHRKHKTRHTHNIQ